MTPARPDGRPELVRGLGAWDGALLTIGATVGTGISITTGHIARVLPHGGLILLVWLAGGLLVGNTLVERPLSSLAGLGFLALGLPVYAAWRRRERR